MNTLSRSRSFGGSVVFVQLGRARGRAVGGSDESGKGVGRCDLPSLRLRPTPVSAKIATCASSGSPFADSESAPIRCVGVRLSLVCGRRMNQGLTEC